MLMSAAELKKAIHQIVDEADEDFLEVVYAMMEAYAKQKDVIGYHPDGKPLTLKELKENVRISEEQYKKGKYTTLEDLEKEVESW